MTLANSLPSKGGLPPKPTVELDTREERLAARLIQRLGLEPPIDVETLASSFASVTTKRFPIDIDGLCLDLKVRGKTPKIWIAHGLHRVRRRFTLAHEIGHIIIPWHSGTIVDDLDAPHKGTRSQYHEMEAEANRFAAELLMPKSWVLRTIERSSHPTILMNLIVNVADVSYPAALFRVHKLSPAGFVGAEVQDGIISWSGRTRGTRAHAPEVGSRLEDIETKIFHDPKSLSNGSNTYLWWKVRDEMKAPSAPDEAWRQILQRILLSVPVEHQALTQSRVNAVLGGAFGRVPKGSPVDQLYNVAMQATQNRNDRDRWLKVVFNHPEFKDYLIARCYAHAGG